MDKYLIFGSNPQFHLWVVVVIAVVVVGLPPFLDLSQVVRCREHLKLVANLGLSAFVPQGQQEEQLFVVELEKVVCVVLMVPLQNGSVLVAVVSTARLVV